MLGSNIGTINVIPGALYHEYSLQEVIWFQVWCNCHCLMGGGGGGGGLTSALLALQSCQPL